MTSFIIEGEINEEKRLIAELPDDVHPGRVRLTIEPLDVDTSDTEPLTLDAARNLLRVAGALAADPDIPMDWIALSDDELVALSRNWLPSRSAEDLIDEARAGS